MTETKTVEVKNLYSDRANERRKQFNNIIRGIDMVLMNNIPEVDESVRENFEDANPYSPEDCAIERTEDGYYCETHDFGTTLEAEEEAPDACDNSYDDGSEVYQWFAVGDNDADFLKRHGQYIAYSHMLDTYFLAICHCGTSWDYVDSMVEAFNDCYHGLENFSDDKV